METAHLTRLLEFTQRIHAIRTFEEVESVVFGVLRMIEPFDSALLFVKSKDADAYHIEGMYPARRFSRALKQERPVFAEKLLFPKDLFADPLAPVLVSQQAGAPALRVPVQVLALLDHRHYRKAFYVPVATGEDKHGLLLLLSREEAPLSPPKQLSLQVVGYQLGTLLRNLCQPLQGDNPPGRLGPVPAGAPPRQPHAAFGMLGSSQPMQRIYGQVRQVAPTDASVLILGESGTGKELLARAVHGLSARKDQALVTLNCAALPASLIESELFGHQKGAFTGATDTRIGKFELAHKGTLFLDEVGELPLELQAKLLRVLQEKEIERLGSNTPLATDVRVVAATNRDLAGEVRAGRFRADLYYRLHVFPITLPPLRDRKEDIPLLAEHLARTCVQQLGRPYRGIAPQALAQLQAYAWPGNVRELENLITQAVILHDAPTPLAWGELLANRLAAPPPLLPPACGVHQAASSRPVEALEHVLAALKQTCANAGSSATTVPLRYEKPYKLKEVERLYMLSVLSQTRGRIRGEGGASQVLGLKPTTLESRIAKMGLKKGYYA